MSEPKQGKSRRGNAGKGRRVGSKNKLNAEVKDMILQALNEAGGVAYLKAQAANSPTAFMALVGKLVPLDLKANVKGNIGLLPGAVIDELA